MIKDWTNIPQWWTKLQDVLFGLYTNLYDPNITFSPSTNMYLEHSDPGRRPKDMACRSLSPFAHAGSEWTEREKTMFKTVYTASFLLSKTHFWECKSIAHHVKYWFSHSEMPELVIKIILYSVGTDSMRYGHPELNPGLRPFPIPPPFLSLPLHFPSLLHCPTIKSLKTPK